MHLGVSLVRPADYVPGRGCEEGDRGRYAVGLGGEVGRPRVRGGGGDVRMRLRTHHQ